MKTYEKNDCVVIEGVSDFNPVHTFDCGQCFRWEMLSDGSYNGMAFSKPVNVRCENGVIIIKNISLSEFESQWKHYLDLDVDYSSVKKEISVDENVRKAMEFGWGIRILNQEMFECLISFIISTQNAIPRIKKIVAGLCRMYGSAVPWGDEVYYAFPSCEQLSGVTENDLAPLKAGYRAAYIVDAVRKVSSGEIDLGNVKKMPYSEAKKELMKIRGVGPKVADCVLLFSGGMKQAFPIDVWVKRTVQTLYLDDKANEKQISEFAAAHFGKYAGLAQQYLFYYGRENKIG